MTSIEKKEEVKKTVIELLEEDDEFEVNLSVPKNTYYYFYSLSFLFIILIFDVYYYYCYYYYHYRCYFYYFYLLLGIRERLESNQHCHRGTN